MSQKNNSQSLSWLFKTEEWFLYLELIVGALSLVTMTVCIFVSFLFRYLEVQIINLEEIALLMMVVATFVGCSVVTALKQHINIDVALLVKSERFQKALPYMVDIVALVLFSILFVYCYTSTVYFYGTGEVSLQLNIPIWIDWLIYLCGIAGVIIHSAVSLFRNYFDKHITLPWLS